MALPVYQLDQLGPSQAQLLVDAIALEELGSAAVNLGGLAHCASRHHQHGGKWTGSLSVRDNEKGPRQICCHACSFGMPRNGVDDPRRGFKSLGDYLLEVGPKDMAHQFWNSARVGSLMTNLREGRPIELGWSAWKKEKGLETTGVSVAVDARQAGRVTAKKCSPTDLFDKYNECFVHEWPYDERKGEFLDRVCHARAWDRALVEELMQERLLALGPSRRSSEDVGMVTAFRGLFAHTAGWPVRFLRERGLMEKTPFTYMPYGTPAIGDFTRAGVLLQQTDLKIVTEGEPDAVSARHFRPQAGIIAVAGKQNYGHLAQAAPYLGLTGKTVLFTLDRDNDKQGVLINPGREIMPVLDAFIKEKPKAIFLWMSPEGKDLNDFLKKEGGKGPFHRYAKLCYSQTQPATGCNPAPIIEKLAHFEKEAATPSLQQNHCR